MHKTINENTESEEYMKHGLVLEGGAMRGLFTAGVTDVLMENGITFDAAVGVSAGAVFGCNYKSGQIRRAIRYNTRFCKDKRYCSIRSLIKTGDMFGAEFCYHTLPDKLDVFDRDAFDSSPMEFWAVCTELRTGRPVYHKFGKMNCDELEWLRASASMPIASRTVEVGGRLLLDGGVSDSIPLKFMESRGFKKNVVILTRSRDYEKKPVRIMPLIKMKYKKYPDFVKAFENRYKMYNGQLKHIRRSEEAGTAFVIAPPEELPIGHVEHDPEKMLEVYRIGRRVANEKLEALKGFLELT
jgi:predicted patatin/cPLA2 family phospholipase